MERDKFMPLGKEEVSEGSEEGGFLKKAAPGEREGKERMAGSAMGTSSERPEWVMEH